MDRIGRFFSRPAGTFFLLGVLIFAFGLAAANRTLWIIGLAVVAFALLSAAERPARH